LRAGAVSARGKGNRMAATEFTLFAPYNEEAALLADFTDWEPKAMKKDEHGVFRVTVDLEDGDYRYKFRVRSKSWFLEENAWVDVVDPYARRVEDAEQESGIVSVRGGERVTDTYEWQHDGAHLPADHELVIYELHVGDFSGGPGDEGAKSGFQDVIAKLDYLSDLGVNAIELMPIEEYPGEHSWGYNPRHFFAPESSYGGPEDLKALIDACHARGMRVIKDGVYNHAEASSPLTQIDHDYWFFHEPQDADNNWGPEFNYEHYDENLETFPARRFVGDSIRYWVAEYHFDGIRFDAAKQLDNYDMMRWVVEMSKEVASPKPFYTVAEHIPEDPAMVGDGPMDGTWHESFYHTLNDLLTGKGLDMERLKDALDGRRRGFAGATSLVNYLSSHDHGHLMRSLGEAGILGEEAFRRARLGAALVMTAFGVPMIWMGDEFGEFNENVTDPNKLEWRLLGNEDNASLHALFRGLIRLRTSNAALQSPNLEFFHENPEAGVLAYVRWNDEGSRVAVVANLTGETRGGYPVPDMPADGTWHEWTRNFDAHVEGGVLTLDLGPYEAFVFVHAP
jgi:1,4-alpha-glucan branching enzyme